MYGPIKMLKILLVFYASLMTGLCDGQVTGKVGGNGAKMYGSIHVGGLKVGAEGNVNYNSSMRQVSLFLDSVWGSKTNRDMGAYTVNEATKDYDVVVKQELNVYYMKTFLTFFYKVAANELDKLVKGDFDPKKLSSIAKELYGARICDLLPADRDKSFAPDYFFPSQVMHMIFVGRDTCQFESGDTMVEKTNTVAINVENSPDFKLPEDPVWNLLVVILPYSGINTPIERAIIRVGYRVVRLL